MMIAGTALAALMGSATSGLPSPPIPLMVVRVSEKLPLTAVEVLQMFKAKPGSTAQMKRGEHLKLLDLLLIFEAPHFDPMAHLDDIGIEWVLVDASPEVSIENQMDWNAVIKADGAARSGTVDLLARFSIGSKTDEIALKVEITD